MKQIRTDFGTAELEGNQAALTVKSGGEMFSHQFFVQDDQLYVRMFWDERELYEGPAQDLEEVFELFKAISSLRGNEDLIRALSTQKAHPDVEALLHYIDQ